MLFSDDINLQKAVNDLSDGDKSENLVRIHVVGIFSIGQSNMRDKDNLQDSD